MAVAQPPVDRLNARKCGESAPAVLEEDMKDQTITRRALLQTAAASAIFAPAVARAAAKKVTLGIVNT